MLTSSRQSEGQVENGAVDEPAATILLVDDYEAGRYAHGRWLRRSGYRVWEAGSGAEALELAEAHHPNLVILDVNLPDISGIEVCRRLKANPETAVIPVLHISATFLDSKWYVAGLDNGADGYLREPVEPPVLLATVRALLRTQQAEQALRQLTETLEQKVAERTEQVRMLASELTLAEQEEQRRIAHILHDEIQQMLMALQIRLSLLKESASPEVHNQIREMEEFVGEIAQTTRSLSSELAAPVLESEELTDVLRWLAEVMMERYQLRVAVEAEGPCIINDENQRRLLFRMVRELLFNVVKHAGVERARLEVADRGDEVCIAVVDEGAGFDVEAALEGVQMGKSFGLFTVRERAKLFGGHFEIDSVPGSGARVTVVMPKGDGAGNRE